MKPTTSSRAVPAPVTPGRRALARRAATYAAMLICIGATDAGSRHAASGADAVPAAEAMAAPDTAAAAPNAPARPGPPAAAPGPQARATPGEPGKSTDSHERVRLTSEAYPIEVSISPVASLFHWLDSLTGLRYAGMSAGKTVEAHRVTFARRLGGPDEHDVGMLRHFGEIRQRFLMRSVGDAKDPGRGDPSDLLVAFFEADSLEAALRRSATLLGEEDHARLRAVLEHFQPKHAKIWNGGEVPRRFVERSRKDPNLARLEKLLVRLAAFFAVDPAAGPPAHVILTPVAEGWGTHAQANGRHLLVELRHYDELATTASVIVHENAHLLMSRMDPARSERMEALAREQGARAREAAEHLREALPTALGQGVADRMFRPSLWSATKPWYHTREVDRYAKRIYPVVQEAVSGTGAFDEALLRRLLALYDGPDATRR